MKSAKIVLIAASLLITSAASFAVASPKAKVSPIKASKIMIESIAERGARDRGHSALLNEMLQMELAKVNTYLEGRDLSLTRGIELRELVVLISQTVFNHKLSHNLHFVNNETTSEQIHNLVALAKPEVGQSTGNRKLDREFNHRMLGLAKVFHGEGKYDPLNVMRNLKVENNHPVQIPAPRKSMLDAIREAAAKAFRRPAPAKSENVDPQPTLELTEEMIVVEQANAEVAAQAVETVVRHSGPRTLHPETDRFGKVTARMGGRSAFCNEALSPDYNWDF